MGKKSKSKKKGQDKKSHKDRVKERRERIEYEQQQEEEDHRQSKWRTCIEQYDRVWYWCDKDTKYKRGTVEKKEKAETGTIFTILPIEAKPEEQDRLVTINNEDHSVLKDNFDWATRFRVGDSVVVYYLDQDDRELWLPATVAEVWASSRDYGVCPYKCRLQSNFEPGRFSSEFVIVQEDNDAFIYERPNNESLLRFSLGDEVIFNADLAVGFRRKNHQRGKWIKGTISARFVVDNYGCFALYLCTFWAPKKETCTILHDDDEHIAAVGTPPRERLLNSVENNCSYGHIDHLVAEFNLDIGIIQDLVISKAIEFGSYEALLWLQQNASVVLDTIADGGYLHQIVQAKNAIQFFASFAKAEETAREPRIAAENCSYNKSGIWKVNHHGHSVLRTLVAQGDEKILSLILSASRKGFSNFGLSYTGPDQDIYQAASHTGRTVKEKMISEWEQRYQLQKLERTVIFHEGKDFNAILELLLRNEAEESLFKRLIRHVQLFGDSPNAMDHLVFSLTSEGQKDILFKLFKYEEDLANIPRIQQTTSVDAFEFTEPERAEPEQEPCCTEEMDLVMMAAHGKAIYTLPSTFKNMERERNRYLSVLDSAMFSKEPVDLAAILEKQKKGESSYDGRLLEYKIRLLTDDELLADRLEILSFLVKTKQKSPPNAIDLIRWRQCGVLRWLVKEGFIDLDGFAFKEPAILEATSKLTFLDGQNIPKAMTVKECLAFAAVEFDDLQTLQWLVASQSVDLACIICNGLNILHVSAFYGRVEIAYWLLASLKLESLLASRARRKPLDRYFAAHIAVDRGFVLLADLLLEWGCPILDVKGKSIGQVAMRSSRAYVLEWGERKSEPLSLQKDVTKLQQLLWESQFDFQAAKKFVDDSNCLQRERWESAGFYSFDYVEGRLSFAAVIGLCCMSPNAAEFTEWVLQEKLFVEISEAPMFDRFFRGYSSYIRERVDWLTCVKEMECAELEELRSTPWLRGFQCDDPSKCFLIFDLLQSKLNHVPSAARALEAARQKILIAHLLNEFLTFGNRQLRKQLARGEALLSIEATIELIQRARSILFEYGCSAKKEFSALSDEGKLEVDCYLHSYSDSNDTFPLQWQLLWRAKARCELERFCLVAAVEGYYELLFWSFTGGAVGWDAPKEVAATRIAVFRGHTKIIRMFLATNGPITFVSSRRDRLQAAILGATEAGRIDYLEHYLDEIAKIGGMLQPDPIDKDIDQSDTKDSRDEDFARLGSSWLCAAVYGCIASSPDPTLPVDLSLPGSAGQDLLHLVTNKGGFSAEDFLRELHAILISIYDEKVPERGVDLVSFLHSNDFGLNPWKCRDILQELSNNYVSRASWGTTFTASYLVAADRWLELVVSIGHDIQLLDRERAYTEEAKAMVAKVEGFQSRQRELWSRFDPIKKQASLASIMNSMEIGEMNCAWHDRQGLRLVHLAAAYSRKDVLEWLIASKLASLDDRDGLGRTVLQVAEASNSVACVEWIASRRITSFFLSLWECKKDGKWKAKAMQSVVALQAWVRGNSVRLLYRQKLLANLEEGQRFQEVWEDALAFAKTLQRSNSATWTKLKQQSSDMNGSHDVNDGDLFDTIEALDEAGKRLLVEPEEAEEPLPETITKHNGQKEGVNPVLNVAQQSGISNLQEARFDHILMTKEVIKWLRVGDTKYRTFFVRRIQQLASGDRSRIMAKRLTGSKTTIYETYLEQKSGFRILWTENDDSTLLIWYVAKHKSVSRLMELIDGAEERSSRQLTSASILLGESGASDAEPGKKEFIMLDPRGHTPLKLYNVHSTELNQLLDGTWNPPLHLTEAERDIVESPGTVLVLGRSGTGKTICAVNRIDFDRFQAQGQKSFTQLFVARSSRLCSYVENAVLGSRVRDTDDAQQTRFMTYRNLLREVQSRCDDMPRRLPSQYVDFRRFKRELWKSSMGIDALLAWTSIRSFIKGSIEALQLNRHLNEDEYLKLGKKRCRLGQEQRSAVYKLFDKYVTYCKEGHLWDDCDHISSLLQALAEMERSRLLDYQELQFDKIYVDEVQDLIQSEIALFFRLSGPGGLFLAGDPAQSVVEGVEFRFEDIRSVGHYLYEKDRKHIPDKPKIVNVNFRSHSGVLNVASGILDLLFGTFPDAAKHLSKDRGLFAGPRPSVLHKIDVSNIKELISKVDGVVVLAHDHAIFNWKQKLDYPLIYGIREAKGLEFESVIILDFFRQLPAGVQKPFRDLLLQRDTYNVAMSCPEIEGLLKLLYTGTTRCIQRLLFAETAKSSAGDAFVRWVSSGVRPLAIRQTVEDVEQMTRTPDEWLSMGLDNGVKAETEFDVEEALGWLEKAVFCFEKAKDSELARKARAHRSSLAIRSRINTLEKDSGFDSFALELEVARELGKLLQEHFLVEARCLVETAMSFFSEYTQRRLQDEIVSRLPGLEDDV